MKQILFLVLAGMNALTATGFSAISINELFLNPPGTDDGLEFIEFKSSTGGVEAMTGLTFLVIEGDAGPAGTVDVALSLNGFSTGSNGLFLWRDGAAVLTPAPAAGTTVHVADFNPDIENGANTYLIVTGFSGTVGTDYDVTNDGVLDSTPWTSVVDAIGIQDDVLDNDIYALSLGWYDFPEYTAATMGFTADALVRGVNSVWYALDVVGAAPGPFDLDATDFAAQSGPDTPPATLTLSPGSPNTIPEPGTLAALGLIVIALRRRRA